MKLDPDLIHYLTKEHFRVLIAVEMGMKNHELVPVPLIESLAALKRSNTYKIIQFLLKHKLVMHVNKVYDGYALTYMGYDYLALKAFMKRGTISKVGIKIGVGKESDIYLCEAGKGVPVKENEEHQHNEEDEEDKEDNLVVVKFARLGRTSFRTVKNNRDYLKGRCNQSWLYLSRIASLKEFAFMKALYNKGFPTPVPIDSNRHGIVMSYIRAYPMSQVREMDNPKKVYSHLLDQLIRLAEYGLVHGDFNEFNLLIDDDENITIIDFPQMTSTLHPQAQFFFERDIKCVQDFFNRRFGLIFEGVPILETDIEKKEDLDSQIKASGFLNEHLAQEEREIYDNIHEHYLNKNEEEEGDEEDQEDDQEQEEVPQLVSTEEQKDQSEGSQTQATDNQQETNPEEQKDEDEEIDSEEEKRRKKLLPKKQKLPKESKKTKDPLVIDDEYVKEKAKKQFDNKFKKDKIKRNKNKDKKVMKANETIKDYFVD